MDPASHNWELDGFVGIAAPSLARILSVHTILNFQLIMCSNLMCSVVKFSTSHEASYVLLCLLEDFCALLRVLKRTKP
ncbi:hypothetical protein Tco_1189103 [Tanacetum coccineum]